MTAEQWRERLELRPHPEGGWFRETYRCAEGFSARHLPLRYGANRSISTGIYFLLNEGDFSAWHRIKSDEMWHHYDGGVLLVHQIDSAGDVSTARVGKADQAEPQVVVPQGTYFAVEVEPGGAFALAGCTVAPGFDFADFEMPPGDALARTFPSHEAIIRRLSRG